MIIFTFPRSKDVLVPIESEETRAMSLAINMFDLSNSTPRPVLNFTPNSYSSVVMPFTFEEFGFCQSLQNVKISAYRSNPLPQDYYNSMVTQKRFVRPEVGQQLSNCIQVFIERLIKFANDLDFFQR